MKTEFRAIRPLGACMLLFGAASLFIHPFGTVKRQASTRPLWSGAEIDAQTAALFNRSCQSCHSERTNWPWYSYVPPASWFIERDVRLGREHFNLSRWSDYSAAERETILGGIAAAVRNEQMPPSRFALLHPEAVLSADEQDQIYRWARRERRRLRPPLQRSSLSAGMR